MLLRNLFEARMPSADAAFAFGRFNPAHQGHVEVYKAVQAAGNKWFVGTNPSTQGPNDPLTFEEKSAWMNAIYPPIKGHILAEQSVVTLASKLYEMLGDDKTIAYVTDSNDWAWAGKLLNDYNGKEGPHGYYKFRAIKHVESPRVSSATALRTAARTGDEAAFYAASGTDPKITVGGKTYFETVVDAVGAHPEKVKRVAKKKEPVASEGKKPQHNLGVGWMLDKDKALGQKVAQSKAKSRQEKDTMQRYAGKKDVTESVGTMPTTEYVKGIYAAAAENGMGAPDVEAVRKQMVLAANGEVDIMATMQKALQVFRNSKFKQMLADLDALIKQAERGQGVAEGKKKKKSRTKARGVNYFFPGYGYYGGGYGGYYGDSSGDGGGESAAMAQTAKRLTDPKDGATAKLRAAGDKRREDQLKSRNIAKKNEAVDLKTSLQELSNDMLGKYKKAAGADAKKADAAGDFKRGDKRFKGINQATMKQFDNDAKKNK